MNINKDHSMADYNRAFIQVGKHIFTEYGFQYGSNCFYRKNKKIFQAFNLTNPGLIALTIVPFWCDLRAFGLYGDIYLSSSIIGGTFNPSSFATDYYSFNSAFSILDKANDELKCIAKTLFNELDKIIDEKTYIDYLCDKKRYFNCPEEAILFVSYKESRMDIALEWIKKLNYFSLNEYIWNLDQLTTEALCEINSEKQYIDSVFFEGYWRNARYRFPKLYEYAKTKKIDIESVYEKESLKMRDIYRCHFKLDF